MTSTSGKMSALYEQHAADAVQLAYLLTGNKDLAEDLAQDAFVRLFGRFHELRKPQSFPFYLRRTIVNLSRDHFRRLQRERTLSSLRQRGERQERDELAPVDARDELLQRLQKLPARQRAAMVLRFCESLTEHETAETLGTSIGAVNSLVSRALTTLRAQARGEGDG